MQKLDNQPSQSLSAILQRTEPPRSPRRIDDKVQALAQKQALENRAQFREAQGARWYSQPATKALVAFSMAGIALSISLRQPLDDRFTTESAINDRLLEDSFQTQRPESVGIALSDPLPIRAIESSSAEATESVLRQRAEEEDQSAASAFIAESSSLARRSAVSSRSSSTVQQSLDASPETASLSAEMRGIQTGDSEAAQSSEARRLLVLLESFLEAETPETAAESREQTSTTLRRQAILQHYENIEDKVALQQRFQQETLQRPEYQAMGLPTELEEVMQLFRGMALQ